MKETPILYSTPMVKAIIENRKSMTRRIVKPEIYIDECGQLNWDNDPKIVLAAWKNRDEFIQEIIPYCPYGKVGDVLWVKETHYCYGRWLKNGINKTGKPKWLFRQDKNFSDVLFFDNAPIKVNKNNIRSRGWYKRPSIFMPKKFARIRLEIVDIYIEQLNDICEADAILEGVEFMERQPTCVYKDYLKPNTPWLHSRNGVRFSAIDSYKSLWSSINGAESTQLNPWVWVIQFKSISTTGKPRRKEAAYA